MINLSDQNMSDSESSCGLEMISSRLERETQKKRLYEKRIADPIFSSIGQLGKWQYKLTFLLSIIKLPAALIEINGNFSSEKLLDENFEQIILATGFGLGHFIFGILGDIRGRKPCLVLALFIQTVTSLISIFIHWPEVFIILHFITNFATGGVLILSFILLIEFIGPQRRDLITVLFLLPKGLYYLVFTTVQILFETQQQFVFFASIPLNLFICLICLIPESPQWFFMIGSINRTTDILVNGAIQNNLPYNHILDIISEAQQQKQSSNVPSSDGFKKFLKLFYNSKVCIQLFCISSSWIIFNLCKHEEILDIFCKHDNLLIRAIIYGSSILIGTLTSYPLLKYCKRKTIIISINFMIGFSIFSTIILSEKMKWIQMILSLITLIGNGILQSVIYVYSIEIFPVHIRGSSIGFSSGFGRIVSIFIHCAIIRVQESIPWLTPILYCLLCIIANTMILCLPEINDDLLKEIIEKEDEKFDGI